jgi:hypothetical protein
VRGPEKTDTNFYHMMSWRRLSTACGIEVDELARKSFDAWSALLPIVNGVVQNIRTEMQADVANDTGSGGQRGADGSRVARLRALQHVPNYCCQRGPSKA